MNLIKCLMLFLFLLLISFLPVSGQIVNGHFNSNLDYWTCTGNLSCDRGSISNYDGTYYARIWVEPIFANPTLTSLSQDVDVTGYMRVDLVSKGRIQESDHRGGYLRAYIGSNYEDLNEGWTEGLSWGEQSIPITGTGVQTFKLETYTWYEDPETYAGFVIRIDNVVLIPYPILSGYVKNTEGDPVRTNIYINASEDPVESDDATGYYEITLPDDGSYAITTAGFIYDEYNAVVAVSGHTEHNITLSRQLPILSVTNIYPEQNEMLLTWTRNVVVSDVLVYRDTDTNLIGSTSSGSYLTGFYQDELLGCESPYDYWLQPFDDEIAGPKYALSDTTDSCDVSAIVPIYPDIPTPIETPDDEKDEEESLIEIIDEIIDNTIEELNELFEDLLIEPTKVIIEEIVIHVTNTFNWILLGIVYLSTLAGRIIKEGEDVLELIADAALYGTLAVIFILILSFVGFSVIFSNEMIAIVIFVVVGFGFGILPEYLKSEDLPGRR